MPALEPPEVTGMAHSNNTAYQFIPTNTLFYLANKFCEIRPRLSNRLITDCTHSSNDC